MNIDYFTYLASVPSTELPCTWRTASLASCIEGMLGNLKELSRKTTLLIFVLFSSIFPHLPPSPKHEPQAWCIWQGNCGRQFMQMTSNQDSWGCTGGRKREKKIMKKKITWTWNTSCRWKVILPYLLSCSFKGPWRSVFGRKTPQA